jgi:hypothetical protein
MTAGRLLRVRLGLWIQVSWRVSRRVVIVLAP